MRVVVRKDPGPMKLRKGESTFLVRRRTAALRMEVVARLRKEGEGVVELPALLEGVDKACLVGWEGVTDETGQPVPCDRCPCCTPETQASCRPCGGTGSFQEAAWHLLDDTTWDEIIDLAKRGYAVEEGLLGN